MSDPQTHTSALTAQPVAPERDPRASTTLLVALIGAILLLALVLTAQLLFQSAMWIRENADAPPDPQLARIHSEQLAQVSQYRLLDPAKGLVAVPIDDGVRLFLSDLKMNPRPTTMNSSDHPAVATQPRSGP